MHLQGSDARVPDQAAPDPARTLDDDGAGHDGNGRDAELDDFVLGAGEALDTLEGDLAKGRDHDDGKDEDAQRLEAGRGMR